MSKHKLNSLNYASIKLNFKILACDETACNIWIY
jgi:hypothetical protein